MYLEGDQPPNPILHSSSFDDAPRLSGDGRLLALLSDESGRNEVHVVPFPGMNGRWQISTGGASSAPIWGPRGNELFYAEKGNLMKVDVSGAPHVIFSRPQMVCPLPSSLFGLYDITTDGRKFLITVSAEENAVALTQLNVVVGWFTELKQKLATLNK